MWISPLPPLEVVICTKMYLSQTSVCLVVSVIFRWCFHCFSNVEAGNRGCPWYKQWWLTVVGKVRMWCKPCSSSHVFQAASRIMNIYFQVHVEGSHLSWVTGLRDQRWYFFFCEKYSSTGTWVLLSCTDLFVSLPWETVITWFHNCVFNEERRCIPWSYTSYGVCLWNPRWWLWRCVVMSCIYSSGMVRFLICRGLHLRWL